MAVQRPSYLSMRIRFFKIGPAGANVAQGREHLPAYSAPAGVSRGVGQKTIWQKNRPDNLRVEASDWHGFCLTRPPGPSGPAGKIEPMGEPEAESLTNTPFGFRRFMAEVRRLVRGRPHRLKPPAGESGRGSALADGEVGWSVAGRWAEARGQQRPTLAAVGAGLDGYASELAVVKPSPFAAAAKRSQLAP